MQATTPISSPRIDRLVDHGRELSSDGYYGKTSQLLWDTGGSDVLDFTQLALDAGGYHLDCVRVAC